jgi:hypothetical protein
MKRGIIKCEIKINGEKSTVTRNYTGKHNETTIQIRKINTKPPNATSGSKNGN